MGMGGMLVEKLRNRCGIQLHNIETILIKYKISTNVILSIIFNYFNVYKKQPF